MIGDAFDLGEALAPDERPSAIIKRNIAVTTSGVCDAVPLTATIKALGEDNVMFSVDYPYEDPQVAADFIEAAPIGEDVRAKICHRNAEILLRL